MADPVSWLVIEKGWAIVDPDGASIGHVWEVVGDPRIDIFEGVVVEVHRLGRRHYIPAERIAEITVGSVAVSVPGAEVDQLEPWHEPPPIYEIER